MRTTIQLDDYIHELARQYAVSKGKSFTALVEEALREKLLAKPKRTLTAAENHKRIMLKTVGGNGVSAGVDLNDNAGLLDLMEQD